MMKKNLLFFVLTTTAFFIQAQPSKQIKTVKNTSAAKPAGTTGTLQLTGLSLIHI